MLLRAVILTSAILSGNAAAGTRSALMGMYVNANMVDILTSTSSTNFPVTNGTVHLGIHSDLAYARLNSRTREVLAATYLVGTDNADAGNGMIESDANGICII